MKDERLISPSITIITQITSVPNIGMLVNK